ncbi:MAG: hypothetical protein WBL74_06675 [Novosphingobium sp.]|uniref:hypothetical protein n=1 Tax=Novosphingobium sp. TaxID=1874826 RepID=UPI003C7B8D9D
MVHAKAQRETRREGVAQAAKAGLPAFDPAGSIYQKIGGFAELLFLCAFLLFAPLREQVRL